MTSIFHLVSGPVNRLASVLHGQSGKVIILGFSGAVERRDDHIAFQSPGNNKAMFISIKTSSMSGSWCMKSGCKSCWRSINSVNCSDDAEAEALNQGKACE